MSEVSNEIEFEDLMNKGTSEFSYADIQWLKGYAHTFYLQLEDIKKENNILKHRLNDIVFSDVNDDVELGARYLRKIGYIDFDEERKVYLNKHNKEPFWEEDEREKDYYIQDKELDEYTKQLEYKLQQKENIIKEVRDLFYEKCRIKDSDGRYSFNETDIDEFRNLLDKEVN